MPESTQGEATSMDEEPIPALSTDSLILEIPPRTLSPHFTQEELLETIASMNLDVDLDGDGLRFNFDIAFRSIPISRGTVQKSDYHLATRGIQLIFRVDNGSITSHTEGCSFEVKYENKESRERCINLKVLSKESKSKPGSELSYKKGDVKEHIVKFENKEQMLAATLSPGQVEWVLSTPHGDKAVREFIVGNLYLFALTEWNSESRSGDITLRLSDVSFFDSDRRKIDSRLKSIGMWYAARKEKVKVPTQNVCSFKFEVQHENS